MVGIGVRLEEDVFGENLALVADDDAGAFDDVSQFANVAWPIMLTESLERARTQDDTGRESCEKGFGELFDVA